MTDRALMGTGDPARSVFEPARVPGHGSVPAPVARAWLRRGLNPPSAEDDAVGAARVWVRRLYTSPDRRDLVAMDSRRRLFRGLLRRMLVLRDDVCSTAWCEAPIAHADHTVPARHGGPTSFTAGAGMCARCNLGKEAPGWSSRVLEVTTPLGRVYESQPPPLLGWGSASADHGDGCGLGAAAADGRIPAVAPAAADRQVPPLAPVGRATPGGTTVHRWVPGRKRPCRRARVLPPPTPDSRRPRRARLTSHLERRLCRLLL